jgi:hypothetical protein
MTDRRGAGCAEDRAPDLVLSRSRKRKKGRNGMEWDGMEVSDVFDRIASSGGIEDGDKESEEMKSDGREKG